MKDSLLVFLFFLSLNLLAQEYTLQKIEVGTNASFRGLSVVDDQVAWVSGSKGWVGKTNDGGKSWSFNQVSGFENSDFRSLYAFDELRALIANAGSPASILITSDGGKNWKPVYTLSHEDAFFDGIDFWNDNDGIIYGDPIDGRMLLLQTSDGGSTWNEITNAPALENGEASFAASGTGIRCSNKRQVMISTGGKVSRIWVSKNKGASWATLDTPILQGESSTGIFSFIQSNKVLIIVGGDYLKESATIQHNFYSLDGGKRWLTPAYPARGYRECIESITHKTLIATGPSGTDISLDNGITWKALSDDKGLHVVRKARKGSLVLLAGANGNVFLLK